MCQTHTSRHRQVIPKGNQAIAGAAECLWAHNYPVGVCNCIFHTRNYLFAPLPAYFCMRFKCLSLRIWPWYLKIQNFPKCWSECLVGIRVLNRWKGCFISYYWHTAWHEIGTLLLMTSHLLNISLGSFGMQLVSCAARVKGEEMYVYPTGRKCRERVLNEVEARDLARSRKWKVIQVAVLKGYLLLSSSLTFALVSNTYNLLWNILWLLLSAAP